MLAREISVTPSLDSDPETTWNGDEHRGTVRYCQLKYVHMHPCAWSNCQSGMHSKLCKINLKLVLRYNS